MFATVGQHPWVPIPSRSARKDRYTRDIDRHTGAVMRTCFGTTESGQRKADVIRHAKAIFKEMRLTLNLFFVYKAYTYSAYNDEGVFLLARLCYNTNTT